MHNPSRPAIPRFEEMTETPGLPVTAEAADMMYTRYARAAELAAGRRVLELASGGGQGLPLISEVARSVVASDYSPSLLRSIRQRYPDIPLARLTAERLPFADAVFEIVLFFEGSYYVPDLNAAFVEISRVLQPGGTALFVNANPERPDFIPSPYAASYPSADQFQRRLTSLGFSVASYGAFPLLRSGAGTAHRISAGILRAARRALTTFRLVPRTMKGRARLKQLLYRDLKAVPQTLYPGFARTAPLTPLAPGPVRDFKVLYIFARKGQAPGTP